MTKAREPSTFEDAILRIVDRIGWDGAADIVGKGERVIRNWSDPDMDRQPTIDEALALDEAYLKAGGTSAPLMAVYTTRLERIGLKPAKSQDIALATAMAAKETGEAIAAAVAASQPAACHKVRSTAEKELGEAIEAMQVLQGRVAVPMGGTH